MRWFSSLTVALLLTIQSHAQDKPTVVHFAKDDIGRVPKGWKAAKTGEGEGNVWKVVADATTPSKKGHALAQTAKGPTRLFNICVLEDANHQDLTASVRFKSVQGDIDMGGGLVWRYQDADNYYISRYNPLEENFRVYKVVGGKRTQLATKENIILPADKWNTLSITQVGNHITCAIDGTTHLDVKDDAFAKAGKVGLWTKADAVTYFDELVIGKK